MCENGGAKSNCPPNTQCHYAPEMYYAYVCNCTNDYESAGTVENRNNVQKCRMKKKDDKNFNPIFIILITFTFLGIIIMVISITIVFLFRRKQSHHQLVIRPPHEENKMSPDYEMMDPIPKGGPNSQKNEYSVLQSAEGACAASVYETKGKKAHESSYDELKVNLNWEKSHQPGENPYENRTKNLENDEEGIYVELDMENETVIYENK